MTNNPHNFGNRKMAFSNKSSTILLFIMMPSIKLTSEQKRKAQQVINNGKYDSRKQELDLSIQSYSRL